MSSYLALLRAVNVGGRGALSMGDLRDVLEGLGLEEVRTVLQTGNAVFRAGRSSPGELETRISATLEAKLGVTSEVFVRTAEEWRAVLAENPFPDEAKRDPSHLLVTALRSAPSEASWEALRAAIRGRERVQGIGRHAYLVYPDGVGRSQLTAAVIEGKLGTRGTSRNWNTAQRLARWAVPTSAR
ncbi:MAG TPA: DUF1697 domain-containing protein [Thermoplasmata archaeon]|nr:DUF1697 domain-containing protein [Thermoplasmata archaeon]